MYITKAVDYFDLTKDGSLAEGFRNMKTKFLVVSVTSDWLYPSYQSKKTVTALNANNLDVSYREIESSYGHDAFLLESGQMNYIIHSFLSHTMVSDIMTKDIITIREGISIEDAARVMYEREVTHLPVVSMNDKLVGIVTSWDISRAVALKCRTLDEIMITNVITSRLDDPIELAARRMETHNISALPVVDEHQKIIGVINSESINKLVGSY